MGVNGIVTELHNIHLTDFSMIARDIKSTLKLMFSIITENNDVNSYVLCALTHIL